MVDNNRYVDVPLDEFQRLVQCREINHQYCAAMSYRLSAQCKKRYGYPPEIYGYGFDTSPLPNQALPWLVDFMTALAYSPLFVANGEQFDVGLTGPSTLAAQLLKELCRRLMVYERREQLGRLNAGRRTDSREVGGEHPL